MLHNEKEMYTNVDIIFLEILEYIFIKQPM